MQEIRAALQRHLKSYDHKCINTTSKDGSSLANIEITINRQSYSKRELDDLLDAIKGLYHMDVDIRVVSRDSGSIILTIQLPRFAAEILQREIVKGALARFGVIAAKIITDKAWAQAIMSVLKAVASVIIPQSLYRFATRIIARSLRWVADAVAEVLRDYGFHRAARTVRHIARYLIDWGAQLLTFVDKYGAYEDHANVAEEVDEIEIEGYRYTLGGETYVY